MLKRGEQEFKMEEKKGEKVRENTNLSRKGQVTIFVILGIVIFVVLIFALFVSSTIAKIKLQAEADKAVNAYLESEAVNYYVYTCMDSAVTSSIEDIALQGGVFYDYQEGPYSVDQTEIGETYVPYSITYKDINGETSTKNFNVSYSIVDTGYCDIVSLFPPEYPYSKTYMKDLYGIYTDRTSNNCLYNYKEGYALSGFAGVNNMSRLCLLGSSNTKSISNIEFSPCFRSVINNKERSIEYLLEQQISKRMKECTTFEIFKDDNITVLNDPVTSVTYTTDSLIAETTYNLSVKIKDKEPVVVKHDFSYESDLRIVKMHNYVMSLVTADSQDFLFDIFADYQEYNEHSDIDPSRFLDDYMTVKIINFTDCDSCSYKYDKLIIVEDSKSKIANRSLTYLTMIKNRAPALEYIHETSSGVKYDIVASDDQEIVLTPKGYDPDDKKKLLYGYEGWKETWDDVCDVVPAETEGDPATITCDVLEGSTEEENMPRNWTQSLEFLRTGIIANYTTKVSDTGFHEVTISVFDESGLMDYQVVSIIVFDLPKAVISPIISYDDIEEGNVSIEDPFTLDSSESTASVVGGGVLSEFIWKIKLWDDDENDWIEVFRNITESTQTTVPSELEEMDDLDELIQVIKPLNLSNVGDHNVSLVVTSYVPLVEDTVESLPYTSALAVRECLPHESDDLIFPYNTGSDPFSADHTCCSSDYEIKGTTSVCYEDEIYGEYTRLRADTSMYKTSSFTSYTPSSSVTLSPTSSATYPSGTVAGDKNDVYAMAFERYCDGKRGNICAGAMYKTLTLYESCANKQAGEEETCAGPRATLSTSETGCQNYDAGITFESLFENGEGICNTDERCSTIGNAGYGANGPMLCEATCNGEGDCTNARINECECSVDSCGAQCDSSSDFEITTSGSSITCRYRCSTQSTCRFSQSRTLPCSGGSCLSTASSFAGYCYYDVSCSGTTGAHYLRGDYCVAGAVVDGDVCLSYDGMTSNLCSIDGECALARETKPVTECTWGTYVCDNYQGWICETI